MTADVNNPEKSSGDLNNSDKIEPSNAQISAMDRHARELKEFISQYPYIFGAADIYNVRFHSPLTLAGMLTVVLTGLVNTDRKPVVNKYVVIVPPGLNEEECQEKVWNVIAETFRLFAKREMEPREQAWLKSRFQLVIASDQRMHSVLDVIKVQSEFTSIIVTEAASYRDDSIAPYIPAGASSPLLPEDIWVPQLHALATAAINLAKKCKSYVALDANQLSPSRQVLADRLLSIDRCGVMGSRTENSRNSILATRVDQWDAWVREGRLGQVLRDIEQLPAIFDSNKAYLRIQILYKGSLFPQALQAIREEVASGHEIDAEMRTKLARIAQDAGASRFAQEILAPAIAELHSLEHLESALLTAQDAGSIELEEMIADRLNTLSPSSPLLRERRLHILLANRDYSGAAVIVAEESEGRAEFYRALARFLSGDDKPDYHGLIALAGSDISQSEAYRIASINDALSRQLITEAL